MADLNRNDLDFLATLLRTGPQKFSTNKSAAAKLIARGFATRSKRLVSITPAGRFASGMGPEND